MRYRVPIILVVCVLAVAGARAASRYVEVPAPGTTMQISFSGPVDEHKAAALTTWLQAVAHSVSDVYGRFPLANIRIQVAPTRNHGWGDDAPVSFGRVTRSGGEKVELFVDFDRPIGDFYGDWTATHEFSHLLLPRISWRQRWISEGFASYYQNVLMARSGHYTAERAIRKLEEGLARGRASRPELSPNDAAREGVAKARFKIYWSGAAIALLADVELRQRSGGSESLDTVLDRFQACCLPSRRRWSGPELFATFDSFVDEPVFMPLYRRYADARGFPETEEALRSKLLESDIFAVRTSPH